MKNQLLYTALSLLGLAVVWAAAAPSDTSDTASSKQEALFLARLLRPVRGLAKQASQLEAILDDAASKVTLSKRQGAGWDMDYGWGGGRFGKRSQDKKPYDMYGMGGRFGRDVDHVDSDLAPGNH